MITLFVVPLTLAFGSAAVWALRVGGLRLLWSLCAFALVAVVLLALFLSAVYSAPSVWLVKVILYFLGPPVLFATGSLTLASGFARTLSLQQVVAFAGSIIGLGVGIIVEVYVLGVWGGEGGGSRKVSGRSSYPHTPTKNPPLILGMQAYIAYLLRR